MTADVERLGRDGVGVCYCGNEILRIRAACWPCRWRPCTGIPWVIDDEHEYAERVWRGRHDEANAYDPLDCIPVREGADDINTRGCWLPRNEDGSDCGHIVPMGGHYGRHAPGPSTVKDVLGPCLPEESRKRRPTLNPTARDLHHMRTGERWSEALYGAGPEWCAYDARRAGWYCVARHPRKRAERTVEHAWACGPARDSAGEVVGE